MRRGGTSAPRSLPSTPGSRGAGGPGTPGPAPTPNTPTAPRAPAETESPDYGSSPATRMDPASWQTWWRFNRDAYLDLKSLVAAVDPHTEGGSSSGSRVLTPELVEAQVLPALQRALQEGGSNALVRSSLVALARLESSWGRPKSGLDVEFGSSFFLAGDSAPSAEASLVALGVASSAQSIELLCAVLRDDGSGRAAVHAETVDFRKRAFAAYALGLIAERTEDAGTRRRIVGALIDTLQADASAPYDVQLAALIALGLAPLADCDGSTEQPQPGHLCRGVELSFLLDFVQDPNRHARLRAQAVIPLARLAHGAQRADFDAIRRALLEPLDARSKESAEVRQSCVIGLGLLGDDGQGDLDREIRASLERTLESSDRVARAMALISLARDGARRGEGEASEKSRAEVEGVLAKELASSKPGARAWAAIAIGVYAHGLAERGEAAPAALAKSLRAALSNAKGAEDGGAVCIALGLLRDSGSAPAIAERLAREKDDAARVHETLALGLIGDREVEPALEKLGQASGLRRDLADAIGVALRLLGSRTLLDELARTPSVPAERARAARLLGSIGDAKSVDTLTAWLGDAAQPIEVRSAAAWALGELCDRHPHAWTASIASDIHYDLTASTLVSYSRDGSGLLELR